MKKRLNKKAVSVVVGYILLISIVVVMSVMVYQWMKSYVPSTDLECADGVSMFIKEIDCTAQSEGYLLNFILKNNGKFNIAGYFIQATNNANISKDISSRFIGGAGDMQENSILYNSLGGENLNSMKPGEENKGIFNLTEQINSIKIIPRRYELQENRLVPRICGDATINQKIICQ